MSQIPFDEIQTLIQKTQAGDPTAFDGIVRHYQDRVVACAFATLRNRAQAEDAAQEAFLLAYRDLGTLSEPAAFATWLRRIVFKCCDRFRRRKEHGSTVPLEAVGEVSAAFPGPAQILEERETKREVHQAVAALPEAERTTIALFYMGGHSISQIAAFLDTNETTIKKRLQRARGRLKEAMMSQVAQTLAEDAPSRDTRFVEVAALLRRIQQTAEQDPAVLAAYLDHFGADEGMGADDDAWASLNVHLLLTDAAMDALAIGRRDYAGRIAEPLFYVEGLQNAPPQGYYLMALYDGEAGPYEVDWYWHAQSSTPALPAGARLLFDRIGLPLSEQPTQWGYLSEDQFPEALRRVEAVRSPEEKQADEGRNILSLFWAMWMISGKYVARNPYEERMGFLRMLRGLIRDLRVRHLDMPAEERPEDLPHPHPSAKLAILRTLGREMEGLLPQAAAKGSEIPATAVERAYRYLDLVERTLQAEGKL